MGIKILYIHGFGSTGNSRTVQSLKQVLGNDVEILSPHFNYDLSSISKIEEIISEAKKMMCQFRPDVVIASSFGGFIATFMSGYPRVLINPLLLPSEQLPRLAPNISNSERKKFVELENSHDIDGEERCEMYGLFGLEDELFSYLELFKKRYGKNQVYTMHCGHRIDLVNVENHLLPIIRQVLENTANLSEESFTDFPLSEEEWDEIVGMFDRDSK